MFCSLLNYLKMQTKCLLIYLLDELSKYKMNMKRIINDMTKAEGNVNGEIVD